MFVRTAWGRAESLREPMRCSVFDITAVPVAPSGAAAAPVREENAR